MKRLKVGFQLGEWAYAGTARSHFRILEVLDREQFEPYALVWKDGQNDLLPQLEKALGDHVIFYDRSPERLGPEDMYRPVSTNFEAVAGSLGLDILHGARGGYPEWPLSTGRLAPLQIETSVFGEKDDSPTLDKSIAICHYIAERRGKTDAVIYNPIPPAELDGPNLRAELGIPEDAIVCGRIGRPANFHLIAIQAFARVQKDYPNLWYLVVAPPPEMEAWMHEKFTRAGTVGGIAYKNCIGFSPRVDDEWIAKFHRTIDIFLHARADGEVHSTAIAQAMSHAIPVISHTTPHFNGQKETIGGGGFVAESLESYAVYLRLLVEHLGFRRDIGAAGLKRCDAEFNQSKVVRQIEAKYLEWAQEKGIF